MNRGMHGGISVLLLAAVLLVFTILRILLQIFATTEYGWQLFDYERQSRLYCPYELHALLAQGPVNVNEPWSKEASVLCLPRRTDHNAYRRSSDAFCALAEEAGESRHDQLCSNSH